MTDPYLDDAIEIGAEKEPNVVKRTRLQEFLLIYRLYRRHHPRWYAAKRAWGIAMIGLPF